MAFTPKAWQDEPLETTALSAGNLIDLETRLSGYTDASVAAALAGLGTGGGSTGGGIVGDPMQHGAVGNGIADDTVAIQAAINAAAQGGGGMLDLTRAPQTYKVSAPLVVPDFSFLVLGTYVGRNKGDNTTPLDLTCSSGFTGKAVLTNAAANVTSGTPQPGVGVTALGVSIDMSAATQGSGIRFMGRQMQAISTCILQCPNNGIHFTNTTAGGVALPSTTFLTDARIMNNRVQGFGNSGIVSDQGANTTDAFMIGNVVTGWTRAYNDNVDCTGPGIYIGSSEDWMVFYNHVRHVAGDGMLFGSCTDLRIYSNYVNQFGLAAATGATYAGFNVQNCWGSGVLFHGNESRTDESGGSASNANFQHPFDASITIVYFRFSVNDNSGPTVLLRIRDNIAHQYAAGNSTAVMFKLLGNSTNNRTMKAVGDGNVALGASGAISPNTIQNTQYTGNVPPSWASPNFALADR